MSILDDWEITADQLTKMINENPSLRGMLLGYVAEFKLREIITSYKEVTFTTKFDDHNRKKKGDLYIIYKDHAFNIESKSLQTKTVTFDKTTRSWTAKTQVDASDKREITLPSGKKLNTTLLLRGEFDILAVNCYAFENKWRFVFARNRELPCSNYKKYTPEDRKVLIASLIPVSWPPKPPFYSDLKQLLDEMIKESR